MKKPKVLTAGRRVLFALLAAVIAAGANLQATPAHAAQVNAINADSITLTNESRAGQNLEVNDFARIEARWSIPDQTGNAGDTFSLDLPAVLHGRVGSFNLTPEGAEAPVYGTCEVQQPQVVCTLSNEVVGKSNVGGKLWVSAQVKDEHASNTLTFNVNGTTPKAVPLPNNAPNIGYNAYTPDELLKFGYFTDEKELTWRVIVPGNVLAGQDKLTIHDPYANPGANFTVKTAFFYKTPKTPKCWNDAFADGCMTELWSKEGTSTPGTTVNYDDALDKIVADVNGPFDANTIYTLHLVLTVDGDVPPGSEYVNNATVNGKTVSETATKEASGGGTGSGDALGQIQLVKKLEGTNTVPADTVFPVQFSYQRAGQEVTGTLDLKADGTPVVLRNIVNGTVVTLTEQLPTVAGNTFGDPTFSGEGVTDGGAGSPSATVTVQGTKKLELTLTNPVETPPAVEKIAPVSPTLTPGTCTPGSTTPSAATATPANTPGITYSQPQLTPRPGTNIVDVTLTATAEAGKAIDETKLPEGWKLNPDGTATFTGEITQPECPATKVIPADPTVEVGTCEPGAVEPTDPTITAATTEGITYSTSWAVDNDQVVFTATATAKPGYVIDKDNLTAGWTWNNDKGIAEYTKRVDKPVCAKLVVPVSPQVEAGVCVAGSTTPADPTVTVPETEGITYGAPEISVQGTTATIKVTATRKDGFIINGDPAALPAGWVYNNDGTATFTTTVEQPRCDKPVVPVSPEAKPGVCVAGSTTPTDPTVTVPETENVTYSGLKIEGATVTLIATPAVGYAFSADTLPQGWSLNPDGTATFSAQVEQPKCDNPVVPVSPTLTPGTCEPGATEATRPTVTSPETEGITYASPAVNRVGNTTVYEIIVTARPKEGYVIDKDNLPDGWKMNADGVSANFTGTVTNPVCTKPVVPVSPTVTPGVCTPGSTVPTDPTVTAPETEGITYGKPEITVEGTKVTIKVTATAKEGFTINGDNLPDGWVLDPTTGVATFTTTVEQPKCEAPTPPAPSTPAPPAPSTPAPPAPSTPAPSTPAPPAPSTPADPVNPVDPKVTPGVCKPGSNTPTPPRVELPKVPGLVYGTPMMQIIGGKLKITVTVTPEPGKKIGDLGKGWTLNQDGTATFTHVGVNPVCGKPGMPKTGN